MRTLKSVLLPLKLLLNDHHIPEQSVGDEGLRYTVTLIPCNGASYTQNPQWAGRGGQEMT